MEIRIGTRPSPLALKQVDEAMPLVKKLYPEARYSVRTILTTGDRDKITPLSEVEGSNFFTKELDEALLAGYIDAAIHSSKDLPDTLPKGLTIIAQTPSISPYDALVSRDGLRLMELPQGPRIGASSLRRKNDIQGLRRDLIIVDIRGNIHERLQLIDNGEIDGLIVAHAALIRLGLEHRIAEILPLERFKTHPKQGSLSLIAREET